MPLFRGTFSLKSPELWVSVFEISAELWVLFEEKCRIKGSILEKYCEIFVLYQKNALCFVELSAWFSPCFRNYGSYFCQTWAELWVQILNQNVTPPTKLCLVTPPPEDCADLQTTLRQSSNCCYRRKSILNCTKNENLAARTEMGQAKN